MKKTLKFFLKLKINLLLAASLLFLTVAAPNIYFKALRSYVGPSVFLVTNLGQIRGFGSGFIIKNSKGKNFFVTNEHVCIGLEVGGDILVYSNEEVQKSHILKVLLKDEKNDLCIAEAPQGYSGLSINTDFSVGDTAHVLGHPLGSPLHRNSGEIITSTIVPIGKGTSVLDFHIKYVPAWQLSATISPGNSGSPVVNHYGQVIGIIFAGNRENSYSAFFIGSDKLEKLLSKVK